MKIGIVIPHYGDDKLLKDCLASIGESGDIVVSIYDCNVNNIGFTAATNYGIKNLLSHNQQPDWFWLLNNDTKVTKETIKNIFEILPTLEKEVGVVGFKILSMENPDLIHHAGTYDCFPAGIHKSGSVRLKQHSVQTNEKWVTFASVLVRREIFEEIGFLDKKLFNYFSDSDFCYRARYAGWKVIYQPNFVILHKIGQSQNPSPAQIRVLQEDAIYFQNKWINGKSFFDLDRELL